MAIFKFNYEHRGTSFFFNALFTSVTFAIILVFNDQLDKYLEQQKYFREDTHPYIKGVQIRRRYFTCNLCFYIHISFCFWMG